MVNYTLVNVVAGGDLGIEVDLHNAFEDMKYLSPSYEPEEAPGLHFELPDTSVTVMLFRTGTYHLTGGENVDQIKEAYNELVDILEEHLGLKVVIEEPDVRNLVYNGNIGQEVNLEAVALDLHEDVEYDPTLSPGLNYRKKEYRGLFTLYRTGSYIYTGNPDPLDAKKALESFNEELRQLLD
ncbi:hypothetical protein [Natranaeroarchaeum aerophilus]|uniref:TATA-box-binding protein C n=1 Tax=Natranaeroarchaeum aerophilus TaxID=2917711 RepID=A0AAE3K6H1_9EURY|nr:hypothetical protein [Natranaeroarchaeum aerophilus]MCL9814405.1 hypothetical protein [Natranaeroarchaeum aerophilus]